MYEQVNLSENVVQGQTFQSLEFKDFYGAGAKEKLAGEKKRKQLKQEYHLGRKPWQPIFSEARQVSERSTHARRL